MGLMLLPNPRSNSFSIQACRTKTVIFFGILQQITCQQVPICVASAGLFMSQINASSVTIMHSAFSNVSRGFPVSLFVRLLSQRPIGPTPTQISSFLHGLNKNEMEFAAFCLWQIGIFSGKRLRLIFNNIGGKKLFSEIPYLPLQLLFLRVIGRSRLRIGLKLTLMQPPSLNLVL